MRAWWWVALVCVSCVKTERDYQLEYARTLTPKEPVVARSEPSIAPQPPRVLTVRVYVDLDYQAQVLRWNDRVLAQLASASDLTRGVLNLELKVVSVETWNRRTANVPMDELLAALEREDPAKDVDLVIGFVSSLEIFTVSQEQLGAAKMLGQHAVLRAMDNAEEHKDITRVFTKLTETEQSTLYRERKLHKERSVVLHELGHLLGAPHDIAADSLLNPNYSAQRARFTPGMLQLLVKSLELRAAKSGVPATARALGTLIAETPALQLQNRNDALETLERLARGEAAEKDKDPTQNDRRVLDDVRRLDEQGKHAEALAALTPLLARTPPMKGVASYACQIAAQVSLTDPRTLERCQAAVDTEEDGPALLMLSQAQGATKDLVAARKTFVRATAQFDARASQTVEASAALGTVARQLNFVSWAERYSGRAMGRVSADSVLEWASRKRKWFGLQPGSTVPAPSDEPVYVERFIAVQDLLGSNRLKDADAAAGALERDYPGLAGPITVRCELHMRRQQLAAANAKCEAALVAYSDSLQAHYLLGVMASLAGRHRVCVEHLEFVVANDVTVDDAWQRLSRAYGALGDSANRDRAAKRLPK